MNDYNMSGNVLDVGSNVAFLYHESLGNNLNNSIFPVSMLIAMYIFHTGRLSIWITG